MDLLPLDVLKLERDRARIALITDFGSGHRQSKLHGGTRLTWVCRLFNHWFKAVGRQTPSASRWITRCRICGAERLNTFTWPVPPRQALALKVVGPGKRELWPTADLQESRQVK